MATPSYAALQALIYDPDQRNGEETRASLRALGFRDVEVVTTLEKLAGVIELESPDLILCEVSAAELATCALIQSIRQDRLGKNPFVIVMATSWRRDGPVVSQVINSGADDLLGRPFSSTAVADRIKLQVDNRKRFVVTADYIGPDRRRDARRSDAECIQVPNSLRMKILSGMDAARIARRIHEDIADARSTINFEKVRRNAFQICVQWRLLEQRRPGGHEFADSLRRLHALNEDLARRAGGHTRDSALRWSATLAEAVAAVRRIVDPSNKDDDGLLDIAPPMQLLGQAALNLGRMLAPGDLQAGYLQDVDAVVSRINAPQASASAPDRLRATA
jgi:DNA-binding response OmpR family regulator